MLTDHHSLTGILLNVFLKSSSKGSECVEMLWPLDVSVSLQWTAVHYGDALLQVDADGAL